MALDTVLGLITGIAGDDATLRLIRDRAMAQSAIGRIKAPSQLTSPVVRGIAPGARLTAVAVAEGGTKTGASGLFNAVNYQVMPIALWVPVSNQLYQSSSDLQAAVIAQMAEGIAVGIDNELINNPNSVFTAGLKASAVSAGNTVTETGYLYDDLVNTFAKVEGTYYTPDGVVARRAEMAKLRRPTASGITTQLPIDFWQPSGGDTTSMIFGAETHFVDTRVLPNSGTTAEVRFLVGDFQAGLDWGTYGGMQIVASDTAVAGSLNAFTQNLVLVRVEMLVGFAVVNGAAFATLLEA